MAKRPSLAETMRQAVASEAPAEAAPQPQAKAKPVKQQPAPSKDDRPAGYYAATRDGKKKATAPLPPEAHKQLRQLSLDEDRSVEKLLIEAINDLFKKYGKPTIA